MFTFIKNFFKQFTSVPQDIEATTVTRPVPSIPTDKNFKSTVVPMIATVDVSGNITGYLPLAAEDNGDGTATIKVTN